MRKSCILVFVTIFACTLGVEKQEGFSKDNRLDSVTEEIALDVAAIRGLEFKTPFRCGTKTKDELREYLKEIVKEEIPGDKLAAYQKALVKFGLIPVDMPLENLILELYTEQVAGFYDWRTKMLYLIDDIPEDLLRVVTSHELTHTLQDQYVGIQNLPISREKENDDRIMATQALMEGDAVSVMLDYTLKSAGKDSTTLPDLDPLMDELTNSMGEQLIASAPAYVRQNMLFPYIQGFTFTRQLRQSGGWSQVNRAFEDPPRSTEQILHPKKYLEAMDIPTTITLQPLSEELGHGWTFLDKNTMGEFNINILLNEFLKDAPKTTAMGWDGDLYQVYEHNPSGKTALVWFTTWDGDTDAQEFLEGYASVLEKKYGSERIDTGQNRRIFPAYKNGGRVTEAYMELRENDVLVLDGVPDASIDAVRASAWRAIKAEKP